MSLQQQYSLYLCPEISEFSQQLITSPDFSIFKNNLKVSALTKLRCCHYVYIIQSKVKGITYVGYTSNPIQRLKQHISECNRGAKDWEYVAILTNDDWDKSEAMLFETQCHNRWKEYVSLSKDSEDDVSHRIAIMLSEMRKNLLSDNKFLDYSVSGRYSLQLCPEACEVYVQVLNKELIESPGLKQVLEHRILIDIIGL